MPNYYMPDPEPNPHNSGNIIALILILILVIAFFMSSCSSCEPIHKCNWEDCEHIGEVMNPDKFTSHWGCEEMTDCYLVELTHFMNPEMSYEMCEEYVQSGVE